VSTFPELVLASIRYILACSLECDPVLRMVSDHFFVTERFIPTMRAAMIKLRQHVFTWVADPSLELVGTIKTELETLHNAVSACTRRAPKIPFLELMFACNPSYWKKPENLSLRNKRSHENREEEKRLIAADRSIISDDLCHVVRHVVDTITIFNREAEEVVLELVCRISGLDDATRLEFDKARVLHYQGKFSKTRLSKLLSHTDQAQPVAARMMRVLGYEWHRQSRSWVCPLPQHYARGQMSALALSPGIISIQHCYLLYCTNCENIKSLLSDADHPYRRQYTDGYRNVITDISGRCELDGIYPCYCSRQNRTNFPRQLCEDTPVRKLFALGYGLVLDGALRILCPNPTCGRPMTVVPGRSAYTEYGYVCEECTVELTKKRARFFMTRRGFNTDGVIRCDVCFKEIKSLHNAIVYPENVIVCTKDHRDWLLENVYAKVDAGKLTSADEIASCIINMRREWKEMKTKKIKHRRGQGNNNRKH